MRRLAFLVASVSALFVLAPGCSSSKEKGQPFEGKTLRVLNWGDYIEDELLWRFKERTGAEVVYDIYGSDDELEQKLAKGDSGYDVVFPSDRALGFLVKKELLEPLDRDRLPNWKNLDARYLGTRHDPKNRFTVPYFWGTLAVAVRADKVRTFSATFDVLFDENPDLKGRIAMLDDAEYCVAAALLHLGLPMNSTDDAHLEQARRLLLAQKPWVKAYTTDGHKKLLLEGEVWAVLGYNGDLRQAQAEDSHIKAFVPEGGSVLWVDSLAIPKGASNPELAHAFINYLLDAGVAARNARAVHYASPNTAARDKLDEESLADPAVYPPKAVLDRCRWLEDRGPALDKVTRLWAEVRRQP